MITRIRHSIGIFLVPMARFYIRYSPLGVFKGMLWTVFSWRERAYSVRTVFGATMKGKTNDLVQGFIYYFGVWEPNLTRFVESRLNGQSGRVFIDVGANVGYFSLLAAKCMPSGAVVAIEAFPSICEKLVENIKLNRYKNIRVVNCAVVESDRPVAMFLGEVGNEGATTLIGGRHKSAPVTVEGRPLSGILSDFEVEAARLIKIDVEGAEFAVINGMSLLLRRLPSDVEVVVEITPMAINEGDIMEIFSLFSRNGFFPYVLQNSYDPTYYLGKKALVLPVRMKSIPTQQTDMVFSRVDAEYLTV